MSELLTADEVAAMLGITRQWLGHLVRSGQLPAHRGKRRRYLFKHNDVSTFKKAYPSDTNPIPTKGN